MRLLFLFGGKSFKEILENEEGYENNPLNYKDNNYYSKTLYGDCYTRLTKEFKRLGYVDESYLFAVRYPTGHPRYSPMGTFGDGMYVLPNADSFYQIIEEINKDDILFIRGFFNWAGLIEKAPCFKIFYNGSSAERYDSPYKVSVVYRDIKKRLLEKRNYRELFKCADEAVFYPLKGIEKKYDILMAGNFSKMDKKGQLEFANHISKDYKIAFAGSILDDELYSQVREILPDADYFIDVNKNKLNVLYNKSKTCIINSISTDAVPRVTVEALAAGTPLLVNKRCISQKYVKPRVSGETFQIGKLNETVYKVLKKQESYAPYRHFQNFYTAEIVCKKIIRDIESARKIKGSIY